MQVEFGSTPVGEEQVLLDGQDVTRKIRTEEAGAGASRVAAWPAVRAALTDRQQSLRPGPRSGGRRARHGHRHLSGRPLEGFPHGERRRKGPKTP